MIDEVITYGEQVGTWRNTCHFVRDMGQAWLRSYVGRDMGNEL